MSELEPVRRPQVFEPCEECGAPMDPQQRYCVNCAARRGNGTNPASRYFAMISKRARRPLSRPAPKQGISSRAAAVGFFSLLPLAVALGVMVGRGGSGEDNSDALLQALKEKQATAATVAAAPATSAGAAKGKAKAKGGKAAKKGEGKVVATSNGDVHEVTNFKASEDKVEEDTRIVEENPEQVGEDYITAQQNLPDVVVIGGDGGSAPAPSGVEP
ncbi:MAG TPA: hypothetical protein VFR75_05080 [Solirubrobacterales bacterium]|nr:hypothetical protein [Solirubrobacterales bacterium]